MLKLFRFLKYKYIRNYKLDFFRVKRKDIELSKYRGKRNYIFVKWIPFRKNNYRYFRRQYTIPRFVYKRKINKFTEKRLLKIRQIRKEFFLSQKFIFKYKVLNYTNNYLYNWFVNKSKHQKILDFNLIYHKVLKNNLLAYTYFKNLSKFISSRNRRRSYEYSIFIGLINTFHRYFKRGSALHFFRSSSIHNLIRYIKINLSFFRNFINFKFWYTRKLKFKFLNFDSYIISFILLIIFSKLEDLVLSFNYFKNNQFKSETLNKFLLIPYVATTLLEKNNFKKTYTLQ